MEGFEDDSSPRHLAKKGVAIFKEWVHLFLLLPSISFISMFYCFIHVFVALPESSEVGSYTN